jgi:hypothetical protein
MAESAALSAVLLSRLSAQIAQWDARKSAEPKQWRDATIMGSGQVWLRLDELKEIGAVMEKLTNAYRDRRGDDRPEDARRVRFSIFAFPTDEPGK